MRRLSSLLVALSCFLLSWSWVAASSHTTVARSHGKMVMAMFRLHVSGQFDVATTFWVAWGPLEGHFGLLRLQRQAGNTFAASQRLPAQGQTVFAYLAGHGIVHTRLGNVPGDPVVTIRRTGETSLTHLHLPTVYWHATAA